MDYNNTAVKNLGLNGIYPHIIYILISYGVIFVDKIFGKSQSQVILIHVGLQLLGLIHVHLKRH